MPGTLGAQGLARAVVVVATGDEPAPMRIRASPAPPPPWPSTSATPASTALLLMDSITRFAQAQREVGLAAGEPPATRGFPPSVFARLPRLLERAGPGVAAPGGSAQAAGSITRAYAVLVEGDDAAADPVSEACRGVLDGHLVLDRASRRRGHFPAIEPDASISRVAPHVIDPTHDTARLAVLRLLAAHRSVANLVDVGGLTPPAATPKPTAPSPPSPPSTPSSARASPAARPRPPSPPPAPQLLALAALSAGSPTGPGPTR